MSFVRCQFRSNTSANSGGAILDMADGLFMDDCVVVGNSAAAGGGIHGESSTIINCTIAENSATAFAAGLFVSGTLTLTNSILWGNAHNNSLTQADQIVSGPMNNVNHCDIQGLIASPFTGSLGGTGNIGNIVLFDGPLIGDFHLQPGLFCINAGDNSAVPAGLTTDLDGKPRIQGIAVDMGAYESQ